MAYVDKRHPHVVILYRVRYRTYVRLTGATDNRHLKMAYHDGTLEVLSLRLFRHEKASYRLGCVVTTIAERLGLRYHCTRGTTFHRSGDGPFRGKGKEPDQSFYIQNVERIPVEGEIDLDAGDLPPDLWIEVDGRHSAQGRWPVYAALGVPEVWSYRARKKTLRFLRLVDDRYELVDRSLALPALTPALVLKALKPGEGQFDSEWMPLLRAWASKRFPSAGLKD
jgi:Uma2 family endonuclease